MAKKFDLVLYEPRQKLQAWTLRGGTLNDRNCDTDYVFTKAERNLLGSSCRHKGVLYVFILILMIMVTTLSLITAQLFDSNLRDSVAQEDNLQLYYYAKSGSDWALDLLRTEIKDLKMENLSSDMEMDKKLLMQIKDGQKWTASRDLEGGEAQDGHVEVTVEKVFKNVGEGNVIVKPGTAGATLKPYIRITSIGTYKSTSKKNKEQYVMTALVSQDNENNVIYKPGYDK